jgi:purine nucleosidase
MLNKFIYLFVFLLLASCTQPEVPKKIPVIFDTDCNNELDDQHALAYLIFNDDIFDIKGVTTNRTRSGGMVEEHTKEANRIVHLCHAEGKFPVISGANGYFDSLRHHLNDAHYDGKEAVDLIVKTAHSMPDGEKLLLLPVGKLTNIALALDKDPTIIPKVWVVWLGSNWPGSGEYNMMNDTTAVNPVIENGVELWICTVRGGTMEVKSTQTEIREHLSGKGKETEPIEGRHGGTFTRLGDYLANLWENVEQEQRSLFDMAAVANVKNPEWAGDTVVYEPRLIDNEWTNAGGRSDSVIFWRNYDVQAVMDDFWEVMERNMN